MALVWWDGIRRPGSLDSHPYDRSQLPGPGESAVCGRKEVDCVRVFLGCLFLSAIGVSFGFQPLQYTWDMFAQRPRCRRACPNVRFQRSPCAGSTVSIGADEEVEPTVSSNHPPTQKARHGSDHIRTNRRARETG